LEIKEYLGVRKKIKKIKIQKFTRVLYWAI
jgi:hypothetical protein